MSTYSEYNTVIQQKLGSREEGFWEPAMKAQAINDSIREILDIYDLPEMMIRSTITFNALGVAAKPSDYFRMAKLWDVDSNGIETDRYTFITPDEFDGLATSASYYWTEDYDTTAGAIRLKCKPIDAGTLQIRYVKEFTEVVTTASTDDGLSGRWKEAISLLASSRLLVNSGEAQETAKADLLKRDSFALIPKKYTKLKTIGGIKGNPRIRSYYETHSILSNYRTNQKVTLT